MVVIDEPDWDYIYGYDTVDYLYGVDTPDYIYGYGGDDHIYSGYGDDWVIGGYGVDYLYGQVGSDVLYGEYGVDYLYGGVGADLLYGGTSGDFLYGGSGVDKLYGATGSDDLFGGSGRDKLYGGTGGDWLNGGAGRDYLSGGGGGDTFYFTTSTSGLSSTTADVITDWNGAYDVIDMPVAGTYFNYGEAETTATSIAQAALEATSWFPDTSIQHVFLHNPYTDKGYLVSDLNGDGAFETGVVLIKAGYASDFDYYNIV